MHEFSVVQSLMQIVESHAEEHKAKAVTKIVLDIGVISGIEPYLLKMAFDTFKEGTIAKDAELVINIVKLKLLCKDCGKESVKDTVDIVCNFCRSVNTEVLEGEDMYLRTIEMDI